MQTHRVASSSLRPVLPRCPAVKIEQDGRGVQRVAYEETGWRVWKWRGLDVNYIAYGDDGPAVVLVHGFGASAYQWRYNIPSLAANHRVYAVDLVGFGKSQKCVMDYSGGHVWSDQISDFILEFVGDDGAYVAGNSLGGFAALATAARHPQLIKGIVGLNIAGTFSQDVDIMPSEEPPKDTNLFSRWMHQVGVLLRRVLIVYTFYATRTRIREILLQVYHDKRNVDDDLVRSIQSPAEDPVALDVYYKLIQSTLSKSVTIDGLLEKINIPILLLWGMKDPWMTPQKAERIVECYGDAEFIPLNAGHCVQDECPAVVNENMMTWIERVES